MIKSILPERSSFFLSFSTVRVLKWKCLDDQLESRKLQLTHTNTHAQSWRVRVESMHRMQWYGTRYTVVTPAEPEIIGPHTILFAPEVLHLEYFPV